MTHDFQMKYIWQKHKERHAEKERLKDNQTQLQQSMDRKTVVGLGMGYSPDMRDALKKVNDFGYVPTPEEIHYRRFTSGQWIDNSPADPPLKTTK